MLAALKKGGIQIIIGILILAIFNDAPPGFIKILILGGGVALIAWGIYGIYSAKQRSRR